FFSNQFMANYAMYLWEPDFKVIATLPEYEVCIVLTGVTNLNKTAYDRTFFNKGADRATHALQLYKMGKIKKILITGGHGLNPTNPNTEAELLADFMVMGGVLEKDILLENQAVNTRQNAVFAKETLEKLGLDLGQEYLLITSAFHMKRSKGCFDKVGLLTETFPVDYYASDPSLTFKNFIQPSPNALLNWHILFKEWLGLIAYKLAGYI
ncbi:MAG: YdcF family protein, partial [Anditalea sp.]